MAAPVGASSDVCGDEDTSPAPGAMARPAAEPARPARVTLVVVPEESEESEPAEPGPPEVSANAAGTAPMAEPTPRATASAPTRPT